MNEDIFSPPETAFQPQPLVAEKPERKKRRVNKRVNSAQPAAPKRTYTKRAAKPEQAAKAAPRGNTPLARAIIIGSQVPAGKLDPLVALIESYEKAPADVKEAFRRLFG